MRNANLALKFLLELSALAALGYWGASTGPRLVNLLLGTGAPLVAAAVWSVYAAPKSPRRLPTRARLTVEMAIFAAACAALLATGAYPWAVAFSILVAINTYLLDHSARA